MDPRAQALVSPENRRLLERGLAKASPVAVKAGWRMFVEKAVREHWLEAGEFCGEVHEKGIHLARLRPSNGELAVRCSCGRSLCAHAVAVGHFWVDLLDKALRPGGRELPIAVRGAPTATPSQAATGQTVESGTPFTERPAVAPAAEWKRRLKLLDTRGSSPLAGVLQGLRLLLSDTGWVLQVRLSPEGPWSEAPAAFHADVLSRQLRPLHFARLGDASFQLGCLLCGHPLWRTDALQRRALLECCLGLPQFHSLVVNQAGLPLQLEAESLGYLVQPGRGDLLEMSLSLAGEPVLGEARLLSSDPFPLYRWRGKYWRAPFALPELPLSRGLLSDPDLLEALKAQGVAFAPGLLRPSRRIPLVAELQLRLEAGGRAGAESFVFAVTALTRDGRHRQEWTDAGWLWKGEAPPLLSSDGKAELAYDATLAKDLAAHLRGFSVEILELPGREWACPFSKPRLAELAEWLAALPRGVTVLADSQLAGLARGPAKLVVQAFVREPAETESVDWLELDLKLGAEGLNLEASELQKLIDARGTWVRLGAKGWRMLEAGAIAVGEGAELLERLGLDPALLVQEAQAVHRLHALQLGEAALNGVEPALQQRLRTRIDSLRSSLAESPPLPADLRATLRPYQVQGYEFLVTRSRLSLGAVLADDMGLGKTLQTLAWLAWLAETQKGAGGRLRALIVCPKSVVHGWLSEAARFVPGLQVQAFAERGSLSHVPPEGLLVCNYAQLRLAAPELNAMAWTAVVLDEAQYIKNPGSQVTRAACALKAEHRLALTGTPVENRPLDLWSIFAFVQPGVLGSQAAFLRLYPRTDDAALARLSRRTRPFLLRRTKGQVAQDLPERVETDLLLDMDPAQRALYEAELVLAREAVAQARQPGSEKGAGRANILTSLLRLRQLCCHPCLVSSQAEQPSVKLEALLEQLEELRTEGRKALVFSQFVGMLEQVSGLLSQAGIPHLILTGQTENRQELVRRFQSEEGESVFLLSLRAAGSGLTLTAADTVFLLDPWWNPAVEAQAIDRTHRIGQQNRVSAYRLLCANTIEEKIRRLQREKADLAGAIVRDEAVGEVLDLDQLEELLS